jgi:signal transduction histidine kinase
MGSLELVNHGVLGEVPENLKRAIGIAAKNGQRLATLIDDLLDLQKIEAGEMVFQFKPVDVNDLVHEAVEATAGYADKLGMHVTTLPCPEACRIKGDRSRLIQVMNNLLSNALKFSDEGDAVQVQVEALGDRIRISVHDEGVGIPPGVKDRVFGKFSQVDSSDVRKVGGTGLGLNITKQIVERHDASIDYVSEPGVGSTFFIEFDRMPENTAADPGPMPVAAVA